MKFEYLASHELIAGDWVIEKGKRLIVADIACLRHRYNPHYKIQLNDRFGKTISHKWYYNKRRWTRVLSASFAEVKR